MPAVQKIFPTRGREFWDSLDPNNARQVLGGGDKGRGKGREKDQACCARPNFRFKHFARPEPAYEPHYAQGEWDRLPLTVCGCRIKLPCFHDYQVFLLRGALLIEGQGQVIETSCSYLVKNEVRIGLCGYTT